jgi:hypothetical protein
MAGKLRFAEMPATPAFSAIEKSGTEISPVLENLKLWQLTRK